jgi:hypothetical protein
MWQHTYQTLNVLSVIAGAMSAVCWAWASRVPIPFATGDSWEGKGPFANALAKQSKLNSYGAMAACATASFQVFAVLVNLRISN